MHSATLTDVYSAIGVKPIINARGHNTVIGGSTPSAHVREAMEQAERYFVDMRDLLERTGEIIADLLGAEAAYVTPGAAAALTLGTASFITGDDLEKMARLPDTTGLKNKVLIQKRHKYSYEHATTIVGTKLIYVGDDNGTTAEQLDAAIGPETVEVLYPAMLEGTPGTLSLAEVLEIAHRRDVPVLVDSAGEVFPLDRFRSYAKMGCDLFCFGGKYFGGGNSAGILAGKKQYVEPAVSQGFIGFETVANRKGFGRPMKLDRQEIVGITVALQDWFSMDHARRFVELERKCAVIQRALQGLPGLSFDIVKTHSAHPKVLKVTLEAGKAKKTPEQVHDALREGNPMVYVGIGADHLLVNPVTLLDGDEVTVGQRLRSVLG